MKSIALSNSLVEETNLRKVTQMFAVLKMFYSRKGILDCQLIGRYGSMCAG